MQKLKFKKFAAESSNFLLVAWQLHDKDIAPGNHSAQQRNSPAQDLG